MAAPLGTYSPSDVNMIVGGLPVDGFSPDGIVSIEYSSPASVLTEGADGSPAVAFKRGMRGGKITVKLLQTSMGNNYFNTLLQAQKFGSSIGTQVTVAISSSGEVHSMPRAFIEQEPTADYGTEIGTREWAFIGQIASNFAGNVS